MNRGESFQRWGFLGMRLGNQGPWSFQTLAVEVSAELGISISKVTLWRYFTVNSVGHLNDTGGSRHKHFRTEAGSMHQLFRNIAALHEAKAANQRAGRKLLWDEPTDQSSGSVR